MIDRSKLKYYIGDIVKLDIGHNTYNATIVAYYFSGAFNDYNNFYSYALTIHENKFKGHYCDTMACNYNGEKIKLATPIGWIASQQELKLIKSPKAIVAKLLL